MGIDPALLAATNEVLEQVRAEPAREPRATWLAIHAVPELLSELDRLRAEAAAVIAFVEWGGASGAHGVYQCPACGGRKDEGGHFDGCGFRPFLPHENHPQSR